MSWWIHKDGTNELTPGTKQTHKQRREEGQTGSLGLANANYSTRKWISNEVSIEVQELINTYVW